MPSFNTRTVVELLEERPGLQRCLLDDGSRAYVLVDLIGPVAPGDAVVVNTTAVDLGLGSGGWHPVHWNLSRTGWSSPGSGHVLKLRYTSLQTDVGAAEEELAGRLGGVADLAGLPVVACTLHSQIAPVVVVLAAHCPDARITYVMTESAALPLALSDLVAALEARGLVHSTITAGHAFGGRREAVNLPAALAIAQVDGADVVVVGPGPGVVGTGTALGASALELTGVVDTVAALGGAPVVAVRYSVADGRPRHRGVSDSTVVALGLTSHPARLAVPEGALGEVVAADLGQVVPPHAVEAVEVPDVGALLAEQGIAVTTMGRTTADDPAFFRVAGAAGAVAARLLADLDRKQPGGSVG